MTRPEKQQLRRPKRDIRLSGPGRVDHDGGNGVHEPGGTRRPGKAATPDCPDSLRTELPVQETTDDLRSLQVEVYSNHQRYGHSGYQRHCQTQDGALVPPFVLKSLTPQLNRETIKRSLGAVGPDK